jgi:hypothetical protein
VNLFEYQMLFGNNVRAMLDWERLEQLGARVCIETVGSRDSLSQLRTVWYADADGNIGDYRNPGSHPLTIDEAAHSLDAWPGDRLARVGQFQADIVTGAREGEPVLLTLPTYAVNGHRLLLDATHRAVAAYLSGLEVRALLLTLCGPVDAAVLPDLGRFQS